jgi:hypothetical protein
MAQRISGCQPLQKNFSSLMGLPPGRALRARQTRYLKAVPLRPLTCHRRQPLNFREPQELTAMIRHHSEERRGWRGGAAAWMIWLRACLHRGRPGARLQARK